MTILCNYTYIKKCPHNIIENKLIRLLWPVFGNYYTKIVENIRAQCTYMYLNKIKYAT